jgi:hypothetical protein
MDAVTLANFRVIHSDINPKFQYPGTWYEYFTGDSIVVVDTEERITFRPGEYRIYTSKRIMPPHGFITATEEPRVYEVSLFPNLISNDTRVYGFLPSENEIKLITVADFCGRAVHVTWEDWQEDGFSVELPTALASGAYVITVKTRNGFFVGKLVKQ